MARTIKEWQEYIRNWAVSKGFIWDKNDIDTVLLRLHSEVSEASEASLLHILDMLLILLKLHSKITDASETVRDNNYEHLGEEFADIFIRLADACEVLGIDLEAEVMRKMAINEERPFLHGRARK